MPTQSTQPTQTVQPTHEFPKTYGEKMREEIEKWGMPWFRTGAIVWRRENDELQFLLVHENRVKKNGVWMDGDGGWNLPCGRVNLNPNANRTESFEEAALREVLEESGHNVELGPIVHIGYRGDLDNPYMIAIYGAVSISEIPFTSNKEIKETGWFTYQQIQAMAAEKRLRSAHLTLASVEALMNETYLRGTYVETYPSKQPK